MDRCEKRLLNGLIIRSREITRREVRSWESRMRLIEIDLRIEHADPATVQLSGIRLSVAATYGLSARLCGRKAVHIISHPPYVGHIFHMVEE